MMSRPCCALLTVVLALPAATQDDGVLLHDGSRVDAVRIDSYDVFTLRYSKGGNTTVAADQVAKVTLGKFSEVYRRGLADHALMLTLAREQLAAKNTLMAQMGFLHAAARLFDAGEPTKATAVIEEVQKAIPAAAVHRLSRGSMLTVSGAGSLRDAAQLPTTVRCRSAQRGFVAELSSSSCSPSLTRGFPGQAALSSQSVPLPRSEPRAHRLNCLRRAGLRSAPSLRRSVRPRQRRRDLARRVLLGFGLLLLDGPRRGTGRVRRSAARSCGSD
jgi:hypothetical protein